MKNRTTLFGVLACAVAVAAARAEEQKPPAEGNETISYSLGVYFGSGLLQDETNLDYGWLMRGLKDKQAGAPLQISDQEIRDTLNKFIKEVTARRQEKQRRLGEKNKTEGEAFLAANKDKPGVITLTNGVQYKQLAEGAGPPPTIEDTVTVNYRSALIDGTEIDDSVKAGSPLTLHVKNTSMPRGLSEALTHMKVGSKWQLFVPSEQAYGANGHPPRIGPNAALILEVELLAILPPATNAPVAGVPPQMISRPGPPAARPGDRPTSTLTSDIFEVNGTNVKRIRAEDLEKLQQQQQEKK